jgi:Fe-Mn family superoxide dismutase
MDASIHDLPFDPASLAGLSEKLLRSHHANNHSGADRRLYALRARLAQTPFGSAPGFELNGLKREELIATNSMLLHELYFASLAGGGRPIDPPMGLALAASFGSVERWRDEFVACAKALAGGSGWMLLVFQPREGSLVNQWAADHTHAVAGGLPALPGRGACREPPSRRTAMIPIANAVSLKFDADAVGQPPGGWTKADSVTEFQAFSYAPAKP